MKVCKILLLFSILLTIGCNTLESDVSSGSTDYFIYKNDCMISGKLRTIVSSEAITETIKLNPDCSAEVTNISIPDDAIINEDKGDTK